MAPLTFPAMAQYRLVDHRMELYGVRLGREDQG